MREAAFHDLPFLPPVAPMSAPGSAWLTPRQAECLAFIRRYIAEHGYSPTYAEIGRAMALGTRSSVHRLALILAERGHIRFRAGRARSITLVVGACPVCGQSLLPFQPSQSSRDG